MCDPDTATRMVRVVERNDGAVEKMEQIDGSVYFTIVKQDAKKA